MFAVTVRIQIKPGAEAAFLDLVQQNARAAVRDEPGCRLFDVCTDPDRPGEVFLYELYEDRAAFESHQTTTHFISFREASAPLVESREIETFAQVHR
ncbi:antibiotic biosynthesis monooxygenase [Mameliella alba]|nr:antibiotic biosynthesis monooxygenase [Antarctobacter heliothermus]MBY6146034.1 antibiotic biosynthesis monooxygenase [Mameliella alba]MCA0955219.1 antibiotic biosynthesis monooxygenase [Mameliella alba]